MKIKNLLFVLVTVIGLLGTGKAVAIEPGTLSEICNWPFTPNGVNNVPVAPSTAGFVLFTWETLPNGTVEIRIAPHPDNAGTSTPYACYRGDNGLATGGFSLGGGLIFANYFSKSLSSDKKAVILTPTQTVPEGTIINFSGQCEYKTDNESVTGNGNDFYPSVTFPAYTYGTNCTGVYVTKLSSPTNVAVSASNILTFNEVTNATGYVATVTINSIVIKTLNISGSGEVISAPLNGNASVTVVASDNTGTYANSDASAPASWTVNNSDQTDLPVSIYCGTTITGAVGSANFSVETKENGDIWVTINGDTYRDNGVQTSAFTIAGITGTNILDKVSAATANPNVFRPKTGITIPKGTLISYNGTIEWTTLGGYGTKQFFTNYIYGTSCSDSEKPVVVAADIVGDSKAWGINVSVNATDNIGVTQIKLVDNVKGYMQTLSALTQNGTATYLFNGLQGGTTYNFSIIAVDLAGNESDPKTLSAYTTLAMPNIILSSNNLLFTPTNGTQKVTLSGANIPSDVILTAPSGYSISPTTISPVEGIIADTELTIKWINGLGNNIIIDTDGLEHPVAISLTSDSKFSNYCNYVITQGGGATLTTPALLNISINEAKTVLTYKIAPYDVTGDATWNGGALNAARILVDGVAANPLRTQVDSHTIMLTFGQPLADNAVISYTSGATLIWTTTGYTNYGNNGNCYIDAWSKTYTIGAANCDCTPQIVTPEGNEEGVLNASDVKATSVKVLVDVVEGTYPIKQIKFVKSGARSTADDDVQIFDKSTDNWYTLAGLTADTNYAFDIYAIDSMDNESSAGQVVFKTSTATGITAPVIASKLINTQYYTIDGREVNAPTTGLYIVKKTYSDNSVKTEKVFVK